MIGRPPIRFREQDYGEAQLQGTRATQEDFQGVHFGVDAAPGATPVAVDDILLVLADGMGGENAGEVASRLAVEHVMQAYAGVDGTPETRLADALYAANHALADAIADDPRLKGMGCTLVALVVVKSKAHFISVGDSILWRFRDGALTRLNADHSYGAVLDELASRGEISRERAEQSPDRGLLRSALTGGTIEEISRSASPLAVAPGDVFVLASDGLLCLAETEIASVLSQQLAPARSAATLMTCVAQAQRSDQDNATVQILRCWQGDATARAPARPLPWRSTVAALVFGLVIWWTLPPHAPEQAAGSSNVPGGIAHP